MLESGDVSSMKEIARRKGVDDSDIAAIIVLIP
jgi:hypothetical protein